jgi:hypothetical protein
MNELLDIRNRSKINEKSRDLNANRPQPHLLPLDRGNRRTGWPLALGGAGVRSGLELDWLTREVEEIERSSRTCSPGLEVDGGGRISERGSAGGTVTGGDGGGAQARTGVGVT